MPTLGQWQLALDRANTGMVLEDVCDLREHTGYLPVTHRGHESGFEWFYGTVADNFGSNPPRGIEGRGHVALFVTHSDMRELFCAGFSAAILAQLPDGLVLDEAPHSPLDGP